MKTIYTLRVYYREINKITGSFISRRHFDFNFIGLRGLHTAMECAYDFTKPLYKGDTSARYIWNVEVKKALIFQ